MKITKIILGIIFAAIGAVSLLFDFIHLIDIEILKNAYDLLVTLFSIYVSLGLIYWGVNLPKTKNILNFRKWPLLFKVSAITGISGTSISFLLPKNIFNLAFVPAYAEWFVVPAFNIFASTCIIFRIDFISDTDNKLHLLLLNILMIIALFVVFFAFGSLAFFVYKLFKKIKT